MPAFSRVGPPVGKRRVAGFDLAGAIPEFRGSSDDPGEPRVHNPTRRAARSPPRGLPRAGLPGRHGRPDLRARRGRHARHIAPRRCGAIPRAATRRRRCAWTARRWTLRIARLDGEALGANRYRIEPACADHPRRAGQLRRSEIETRIAPAENTVLAGLYTSRRQLLHPMRGRGLPPHHLLPGPAGRDGALHHDHRRRQGARCPVLLSNGNPARAGRRGRRAGTGRNGSIRTRSRPISSRSSPAISSRSGTASRPAPARPCRSAIWVRRGDEDKCAHAMRSLKNAMRGTRRNSASNTISTCSTSSPCPTSTWARWRTRASTSSTRNTCWRKPETATDADYQGIETVIAHEYFHNWTGNRVTCRDWFQLSLKEGLTVFRDQEFSADQGSRAVKRIGDVRRLRAAQFPEDAGPLAHPVRPEQIHRDRQFLHRDRLQQRRGSRAHDADAASGRTASARAWTFISSAMTTRRSTIEDFVAAMQDATGADFSQFRRWYDQAGTPRARPSRIATTPRRDAMTLTLSQHDAADAGPAGQAAAVVPIAMGLLGADGKELPTRLDGENAERTGHAGAGARRGRAAIRVSRTCRASRCRRCCAVSRRR